MTEGDGEVDVNLERLLLFDVVLALIWLHALRHGWRRDRAALLSAVLSGATGQSRMKKEMDHIYAHWPEIRGLVPGVDWPLTFFLFHLIRFFG